MDSEADIIRMPFVRTNLSVATYTLTLSARQRLAREIELWKDLDHPNILPFIGFHWDRPLKRAWLVMPLVTGGTLQEYMKRTPAPSLDSRARLVRHNHCLRSI